MHKILVIRFYFSLNGVHVLGCISPSSGETFISCTSHLAYAAIRRNHRSGCIATQQPDLWFRRIPAYAKCDVQLIKVSPEDGLIQPETCTPFNGK